MEQEGGPLWLRRALEGVMAKPSIPLESWPGVEVRQVPVADGVEAGDASGASADEDARSSSDDRLSKPSSA